MANTPKLTPDIVDELINSAQTIPPPSHLDVGPDLREMMEQVARAQGLYTTLIAPLMDLAERRDMPDDDVLQINQSIAAVRSVLQTVQDITYKMMSFEDRRGLEHDLVHIFYRMIRQNGKMFEFSEEHIDSVDCQDFDVVRGNYENGLPYFIFDRRQMSEAHSKGYLLGKYGDLEPTGDPEVDEVMIAYKVQTEMKRRAEARKKPAAKTAKPRNTSKAEKPE